MNFSKKIAMCALFIAWNTTLTMMRHFPSTTTKPLQHIQTRTFATRPTFQKRIASWWNTAKTRTRNAFAYFFPSKISSIKPFSPILSTTIPLSVSIAAQPQQHMTWVVENTLHAIQKTRDNLGIHITNLIQCTPAQKELECLSKIATLTNSENFFENIEGILLEERKKILEPLGLNEQTMNEYLSAIKTYRENLNINKEAIDEYLMLLLLKGYVNLLTLKKENVFYPEMPSFYSYKDVSTFAIAHTIAHFLRCHDVERALISRIIKQQIPTYAKKTLKIQPGPNTELPTIYNEIFNAFFDQLSALWELEADITAAMMDYETGRVIYKELETIINQEKIAAQSSHSYLQVPLIRLSTIRHSPKNVSWSDKYKLIGNILKLHKQKQPSKAQIPIHQTKE